MQQFSPDAPPILNSWKEIATYLGRGIRTVQRWEREHGMPIHRIGKGKRSPVFAISHELYTWMRTVDSQLLEVPLAKVPEPVSHSGEIQLVKMPVQNSHSGPHLSGVSIELKAQMAHELAARSLERMRQTAQLTAKQLSQTKILLEQFRILRSKGLRNPGVLNPGA